MSHSDPIDFWFSVGSLYTFLAVMRMDRFEDTNGRAYEAATNEARTLGLFGVPAFVTRGELLWGDDRLEDAIACHRAGTLFPQ